MSNTVNSVDIDNISSGSDESEKKKGAVPTNNEDGQGIMVLPREEGDAR
jgi:hypothetical protein